MFGGCPVSRGSLLLLVAVLLCIGGVSGEAGFGADAGAWFARGDWSRMVVVVGTASPGMRAWAASPAVVVARMASPGLWALAASRVVVAARMAPPGFLIKPGRRQGRWVHSGGPGFPQSEIHVRPLRGVPGLGLGTPRPRTYMNASSTYLCIRQSMRLFIHLGIYIYVYMCICMYVYMYISASIHFFLYASIHFIPSRISNSICLRAINSCSQFRIHLNVLFMCAQMRVPGLSRSVCCALLLDNP